MLRQGTLGALRMMSSEPAKAVAPGAEEEGGGRAHHGDEGMEKKNGSSSAEPEEKVPALHPGLQRANMGENYWLFQPYYSQEDLKVSVTHEKPASIKDRLALFGVTTTRATFDYVTGYGPNMNEAKWLTRFVFLETVAGVPGMVAAMLRHLRSLRLMKRDNGWIHTLLEEAENERMHLLTFLEMKKPSLIFRGLVLAAQGIFANCFFFTYLFSPSLCHRFVGYLEEEAVKTYTHALADLDAGKLPLWENMPAPPVAIRYWKLEEDAMFRDVLLAVRADEACHRHVNHTLSSIGEDAKNPFIRNRDGEQ